MVFPAPDVPKVVLPVKFAIVPVNPPVNVPPVKGKYMPDIEGISAATKARKVGVPADPFGAANTVFAVSLAKVTANVPATVIGEPETEKMLGIDKPTEVTGPPDAPVPHVTPVDAKLPLTSVVTHWLATAFTKVTVPPFSPAEKFAACAVIVPVKVGLADSTTFPLPVVAAKTSCDKLLLPSTVADAGIAAPLTLTTVATSDPDPGPASTSPVNCDTPALIFVPGYIPVTVIAEG